MVEIIDYSNMLNRLNLITCSFTQDTGLVQTVQ